MFANGGYQVEPHIISEVRDRNGEVVYRSSAPVVCAECLEETNWNLDVSVEISDTENTILQDQIALYSREEIEQPENIAEQVMDPRVAYIMDSILRDVIIKGTGTAAQVLDRADIAGKTGTTNGPRDAWFSGYSPHLVATTWVGFDNNSLLGLSEFGGTSALPIWIDFMDSALEGKPDEAQPQPEGIVTVLIDPETGQRAPPGAVGAEFELFLLENAPELLSPQVFERGEDAGNLTESLF